MLKGLTVRCGSNVLRHRPDHRENHPRSIRGGEQVSPTPSLAVVPFQARRSPVPFVVHDGDEMLAISTANVVVEIDKTTGALTYRQPDGTLLTREPRVGGRTLDRTAVTRWEFDAGAATEERGNVDGVRMAVSGGREVFDREAYHVRLAFEWMDGEALYGLGSHEEGMFNLRGQHQYLYQENLKIAVPVLLSTRGYGVFLDCTSLVTFHDDAFGSYLWGDVDEETDYYFMVGPEFDTVIGELRALTGGTPMLPRWAFGYLHIRRSAIRRKRSC